VVLIRQGARAAAESAAAVVAKVRAMGISERVAAVLDKVRVVATTKGAAAGIMRGAAAHEACEEGVAMEGSAMGVGTECPHSARKATKQSTKQGTKQGTKERARERPKGVGKDTTKAAFPRLTQRRPRRGSARRSREHPHRRQAERWAVARVR